MLAVKTLILSEHANEYNRDFDSFTDDRIELMYGSSLEGLRYESVQYNVDSSYRNETYDAYVRSHQARRGYYAYMKAVDDSNRERKTPAVKLTKTIEEVREIARREVKTT